jgi:hypothetical protein
LLNLEKVMFRATADGSPPGVLLVSAVREGVHRDGPDGGPPTLEFNIGAIQTAAVNGGGPDFLLATL